ncbi:MAG: hypothetical protein GIW95_12030 [Candidatus Eremiobacteraeota bacterium]|nr:hypothetical protein [Candidatus Eremiobacteraeota bacterium]
MAIVAQAVAAPPTARAIAPASSLQTLHVRDFTLRADPATLHVGETLRLRISVRVDERLLAMDNVVLPNLAGFVSLGDERQCVSSGRGTECVETMSLEATALGDVSIAAATLDAVDASTNKPSRFATNGVTVRILPADAAAARTFSGRRLAIIAAALLALAAAAFAALIVLFARAQRQAHAPPKPAPAPAPAAPPQPPRDPLFDVLANLRAQPTRANALRARAELRRRAGARADETCDDLCLRRNLQKAPLGAALRAIEIASFAPDAQVEAAIANACPQMERLIAGRAP